MVHKICKSVGKTLEDRLSAKEASAAFTTAVLAKDQENDFDFFLSEELYSMQLQSTVSSLR